jgi:subtilase family serine protease
MFLAGQEKGEIMIRKLGRFALSAVAVLSIAPLFCQAQSVMTHHVRDEVRTGALQASGTLPPNQVLQLDLVLPLRDEAGLDAFLSQLYNSSSASYRHFLSVQEFTARFGPSQAQYDAVVSYATRNGLTVEGGTRDGMDVQVAGTVAAIEAVFHVTLRTYLDPTDNHTYYSIDTEPTTGLPFNLWHISGLDNLAKPYPLFESKASYAKAHGGSRASTDGPAPTGSGEQGQFLGSDMRAAYYGNGPLTGAGQNLGLFEFGGTDLVDLNAYYQTVNQTYPGSTASPCTSGTTCTSGIITLISTDGTSIYCAGGCHDDEQTADMTQALGMAPGLASLTLYIGSGETTGITAILAAMVSHSPLATTISSSFGWGAPADPTMPNIFFKRMAAQGQTFFQAAGDTSNWSKKNNNWPADNPYVVSVGGTVLVTSGAGGPWQSETAWPDSGGGVSPNGYTIPSWQQFPGIINSSNKGSTTLRNGPDVSANANGSFFVCNEQIGCSEGAGGTSFAAPMWAGYIALLNQQNADAGQPPFGFLDPDYAGNESGGKPTAAYAANFHDITSGTSGSFSAVPEYDLVTGWGSPNGSNPTVPMVVGFLEKNAVAAIVQAGLVQKVDIQPGCLDPGSVLFQSPSGGSRAKPGSTVTILIDSGVSSRGKKCIPF